MPFYLEYRVPVNLYRNQGHTQGADICNTTDTVNMLVERVVRDFIMTYEEAACMCLSLVANDTGLGIYKRKKESQKTRKHTLVQEEKLFQEKKNLLKKTRSLPRKRPRKSEFVQEKTIMVKKNTSRLLFFLEQFFFLNRKRGYFSYKFPAQAGS